MAIIKCLQLPGLYDTEDSTCKLLLVHDMRYLSLTQHNRRYSRSCYMDEVRFQSCFSPALIYNLHPRLIFQRRVQHHHNGFLHPNLGPDLRNDSRQTFLELTRAIRERQVALLHG